MLAGLTASVAFTGQAPAQHPDRGLAPFAAIEASLGTAESPIERSLLSLALAHDGRGATLYLPLSPRLLDSLATACFPLCPRTDDRQRRSSNLSATVWINTSRPNPDLDGPVWQGRGVTAAVRGGAVLRRGVFSGAIRPVVFATSNLAYTPGAPRVIGTDDFRDPVWGSVLDMPFRFGDQEYYRVDPGESYARVDVGRVGAGFATSTQQWGPSHEYPLMMGGEAGGYPRFFVEGRDMAAGVGVLSAHYSVGRLESSGFSELRRGERSRLVTAAVATFRPVILSDLQLGASRLFHTRWVVGEPALATLTLPFKGLLKAGNPTSESVERDVNQLASIFFRLSPRGSHIELYGEMLRDDHNANLRDLIGEPDHFSAYTLGIHRARMARGRLRTVTMEVANARQTHLSRVRDEGASYTHGAVGEGHTFRGQPLGSVAVIGGGGMTVTYGSAGSHDAWYAVAESRFSVQPRGGPNVPASGGYHAIRWGRTSARTATAVQKVEAAVMMGFGVEKGINLMLTWTSTWQGW